MDKKHRGANEGSIYQRKDTEMWYAQVLLGYKPRGQPHRKLINAALKAALYQAQKVA